MMDMFVSPKPLGGNQVGPDWHSESEQKAKEKGDVLSENWQSSTA